MLFTRYRFGWEPGANGLVLAGIGLSQAIVEGVLLATIAKWFGDRRTALMGYATLAVRVSGWMRFRPRSCYWRWAASRSHRCAP